MVWRIANRIGDRLRIIIDRPCCSHCALGGETIHCTGIDDETSLRRWWRFEKRSIALERVGLQHSVHSEGQL